jgi:predicted DNA-binding transcriptional regulator AlpA
VEQPEKEKLLPAAKVRQRYDVSDMSIWRWLHNDELGFPKPLRINKRRFWRLSELRAWEDAQTDGGAQ